MKPHEVARLVGIHTNSVRNWTNDFAEFFSPNAQGGDGHMRNLTEDDTRVIAFINQLKREGRGADEIFAALRAAERKGFDTLPNPAQPETVVPMAVVPRQAAEEAIKGEHRALQIMRDEMHERLEELRNLVEYERKRAHDERERFEQSNSKIIELTETIGELKGKLSLLEQQLAAGGDK